MNLICCWDKKGFSGNRKQKKKQKNLIIPKQKCPIVNKQLEIEEHIFAVLLFVFVVF